MKITLWEELTNTHGRRVELRNEELVEQFLSPQRQLRSADEKKTLPGWSPATFDGDRRKRDLVEEVSALVLDYDAGDPFDEVVGAWSSFCGVIHTTPTSTEEHPRLRVVLFVSRSMTVDEHSALYDWALREASRAGHHPDISTRDPSRFWYVPAAGSSYRAEALGGEVLDVTATVADTTPRPERGDLSSLGGVPKKATADWFIERVANTGQDSKQRNNTLNSAAFVVAQRVGQGELPEAEARSRLVEAGIACGLGRREVEQTVRSAFSGASANPRALVKTQAPGLAVEIEREDESLWQRELRCNKEGKLLKTPGNLLRIFENDPQMRGRLGYDEFAARVSVTNKLPWGKAGPRGLVESDFVRAIQWLEDRFAIAPSVDMTSRALAAVAELFAFNPLRDYLRGVQWDGVERLDHWLVDLFGVEPSPLNRAFGRRWAISAVARGLDAGCQADHVLVLEGTQGVGKSSGLAALAGSGGHWYSDNVPALDQKEAAMALHGRWIVELAELEGMRRADVAKVKAFLTRRTDKYRPPWGRCEVEIPRHCVFAGTTNEQATGYLKDSTGNRRFWCVESSHVNVDAVRLARDALWAEAVQAFDSGEPWWFGSGEMVDELAAAEDLRFDVHPWEDKLTEYAGDRDRWTIPEALSVLGVPLERQSRRDSMTVAGLFYRLGFQERRRELYEGRRQYVYYRTV
jgi:predicted P-loop ATPase